MHVVTVLLRVEKEIMQKTPAGQHYESLFWKHSEEIGQILFSNPENSEEIMRVLRLYTPGLEALLNGDGHKVRITSEQVEGLKEPLEWFAARGSVTLHKENRDLTVLSFYAIIMNT